VHWIVAPEKDTATLSRFHPALPPEAINTVIDKLTRDRSAMRAWREAEQVSVLSPPVYDYFDPPWTPAVLRRNETMLRTEEVAGPGKVKE
jgi:hypothetical protein